MILWHVLEKLMRKAQDTAEKFANVPSMATLNQTQMFQLLSLPDAEETERFIEQKAERLRDFWEGVIKLARPRKTNRETLRTERISLALPAADYAGVSTLAAIQGVSLNEFLCAVVAQLVQKNLPTIESFNAARQQAADSINLNVDDE